jgi:hypothetical protein
MAAPDATAPELAPSWHRAYAIATCAVIGGTLAYALCTWGGWTRLQHDPYRDTWWWQAGPTQAIPINYYGDILWGLGGAAAGALVGAAGMRVWRRPLSSSTVSLLAAWAMTCFVLSGLFYTWSLWPF